MGICNSNDSAGRETIEKKAKNRTKAIERAHARDMQEEAQIKKLLLLGAGESGKSTLFKQMITLYGPGFTQEDLDQYKKVLHNNAITAIQTLAYESDALADEYGIDCRVDEKLQDSKNFVLDYKVEEETPLTAELVEHIKLLWADPGIQTTYENRSKYQLPDSTAYLMTRLDAMIDPDYVPTEMDALRSRSRTTGIVHVEFEIEGTSFTMYDVGGQRNERRKWIYCFDNVTAVCFVVAISEYDQVCFEDESTNRIDEALNLFRSTVNSEYFSETNIILFLNKRDLFEEKLKRVPLTVYDPEYTGGEDLEAGYAYFRELFLNASASDKQIVYPHETCATDKDQVLVVFNGVKDTIVRTSLRQGGLMD
jgi:GTPase SAR1 family protein